MGTRGWLTFSFDGERTTLFRRANRMQTAASDHVWTTRRQVSSSSRLNTRWIPFAPVLYICLMSPERRPQRDGKLLMRHQHLRQIQCMQQFGQDETISPSDLSTPAAGLGCVLCLLGASRW